MKDDRFVVGVVIGFLMFLAFLLGYVLGLEVRL